MFPFPVNSKPCLLALFMTACSGACGFAGESPSQEAIAKLGLKPVRTVLVLETQEAEVHDKIAAARQLDRDWSNAVMQQRSTLGEKEYQAAIKELTAESNQFKSELQNTNRMIAQLPRYRNRLATNLAYQQYEDLNLYKTQLQWELNQRTTFLNQLKSQKVDPKAREKVDATVRDRSELLHQAVMDLRKLVETTEEKYKALSKDDDVKKYQDLSEHKTGIKLHLGPSRQFHLDVKVLEKLEKETSSGEVASPAPRSTRKTHRSSAGKRSSKASAGSADSSSPF